METAVSAAQAYLARGYAPVDIPHGRKGPVRPDWQHLRLVESDLPVVFRNGSNIGLLLGEPSGGLVDVDLDCEEARLVAGWLPETHMRHGRSGRPPTHAWYRARPCPERTRKYEDADGATLVELRSTGGQTVVPPSVYPPDPLTGEVDTAVWAEFGEPADVDGDDLAQRVAYVAAGALLIRHWPARGMRDEVALALAGTLVRHGWDERDASAFIAAVATCAGDEETAARAKKPEASARRLAAGRHVYGLPTLARLLGSTVVDRLTGWLGLQAERETERGEPVFGPAPAGSPAALAAQLATVPPLPAAALIPDDLLDAIAAVRGAWLDPYIAAARAISPRTPRALLEASGLFGLSCALARRVYVQAGGVALYPSLYLLFVGRSTLTGKTTALKVLRRLFREAGLLSLLLPDRFTEQALAVELSLHVPRHVAEGGEKMQLQWAERHRHAAQRGIIRDEMHGLLDDCNRDYNAGLLPLLLSMDGAPDDLPTELTISRGWVEVRHVCVNLLGATTPAGIRIHAAKAYHWANGLFGRFALIGPDEPARYAFWTKAEIGIPEPVLWGIKQVYSSFPQPTVQFEYAEDGGTDGEPTKLKPVAALQAGYCPQRCLIADEAWDAWQRYNEALWTIAKASGSERLEPTYGRLDGLALRVALILAAAEWALLPEADRLEVPVVQAAHWYAAQQIAERWRSGSHAILASALEEEERAVEGSEAAKLLRLLRENGGRMKRGAVLERLNWLAAHLDDVLGLVGGAVRQERTLTGGRPAVWLMLAGDDA